MEECSKGKERAYCRNLELPALDGLSNLAEVSLAGLEVVGLGRGRGCRGSAYQAWVVWGVETCLGPRQEARQEAGVVGPEAENRALS